jgi:C1A family cysteine protease
MNRYLILLVLLASSGFSLPAHDGESIEEFEKEFGDYWEDPVQKQQAADELAKEEASIEKDNEDYDNGLSTYKEKINELSDLTTDEMEKLKEGAIDVKARLFATGAFDIPEEDRYLSPDDQAYLNSIYDELSRASIPDTYDARTDGLITEPKSQGSCGSCAAFAATTVHETCLIKAGTPFTGTNLAEQQLVDCGYNGQDMNGCNGANTGSYVQWMVNTAKGQYNHEADYAYLDREPNLKCQNKPYWNGGSKVSQAVVDWWCDETKLKALVYKYGAVATHIYASDPGFGNYASGVFNDCSTTSINHAVVVVGYGTENGSPYWLVKNSWGSNWGDNGYIKMYRGNGICGIGGLCVAAECEDTGTASPAPVAPPPPPVPASQICDVSCAFPGINGGVYTLYWGDYTSSVNCDNGTCSPSVAGPSNACMYICGRVECC